MRRFLTLVALSSMAFVPAIAHADLTGDSVTTTYLFPTQSTVYGTYGTVTIPGVTTSFGELSYTFTGTSVTVTLICTTCTQFDPGTFNGPEFTYSVPITSMTEVAGATQAVAGYSFSGDNVFINFVNEPTALGDSVTFDIDSSVSTTPEPSSLILLGTGVLGMAGMVRRRFKR